MGADTAVDTKTQINPNVSTEPLASATVGLGSPAAKELLERVGSKENPLTPSEDRCVTELFRQQLGIPSDCTITLESRHVGPDKGAILTDERGRRFAEGTQYVRGTLEVPTTLPDGQPSKDYVHFQMLYPPSTPVTNCWIGGLKYNPQENPELAQAMVEMKRSTGGPPWCVGQDVTSKDFYLVGARVNPDPRGLSGEVPYYLPNVIRVSNGKVEQLENVTIPKEFGQGDGVTSFKVQNSDGSNLQVDYNPNAGKGSRRGSVEIAGKELLTQSMIVD